MPADVPLCGRGRVCLLSGSQRQVGDRDPVLTSLQVLLVLVSVHMLEKVPFGLLMLVGFICQIVRVMQVPPTETVPQVKKEKHSTQAKNRAKRKPPKGMFLSQEDVEAVSANASAAATVLRQLDMELVSIKRQVRSAQALLGWVPLFFSSSAL